MRQLLQPIAAFVCCNRQAPHAGATRLPAAGDRLNAPANSAHSLKLFYFITQRRSCSFAEYWKHFMARFNDVHASGYNTVSYTHLTLPTILRV